MSSLSVNKLKSGMPFEKYNIDVSLDEIENNESGIKLKYKFVLLSTPTNAKISIEGITSLTGSENEVSKYLEPDERNIPVIVNIVYQELLPLLYVLTKSIDIPCPAYKISQISQGPTPQSSAQPEPQELTQTESKVEMPVSDTEPAAKVQQTEVSPDQSTQQQGEDVLDELEKLVEEQNVSSI
ncbi:MAG: hypothetical protein ABI340_10450 [Nitrososphaera sp.]